MNHTTNSRHSTSASSEDYNFSKFHGIWPGLRKLYRSNQWGPTFRDPVTPPLGMPESACDELIHGESPEERAYRRFPIAAHKPGGW